MHQYYTQVDRMTTPSCGCPGFNFQISSSVFVIQQRPTLEAMAFCRFNSTFVPVLKYKYGYVRVVYYLVVPEHGEWGLVTDRLRVCRTPSNNLCPDSVTAGIIPRQESNGSMYESATYVRNEYHLRRPDLQRRQWKHERLRTCCK
jgi:hypothetical protein